MTSLKDATIQALAELLNKSFKTDLKSKNMTNPYLMDLDFDTKTSQIRFELGLKGLPDSKKFNLSQTNLLDFCNQIEKAANNFYWGSHVHDIQTTDEDGNIKFVSIIDFPRSATIQEVKDDADRFWGPGLNAADTNDENVIFTSRQRVMIR